MKALLTSLLRQFIREGNLCLVYADGSRQAFGDGTGPLVAARFADKSGPFELVRGLGFALGELYMDGRFIMTEGSIFDFRSLFLRNARQQKPPPLVMAMLRIRQAIPSWPARNDRNRSKGNVAHHYDLNGKLFELFLDRSREYSCAYFERPDMDLEEAQRAKERHIAAKLLVEPGQKILDIGSGWGGLALYLARYCGADVTGITLSEEQVQAANIDSARAGLADRVRFRLEDYREVDDNFDRIVSVGMFEHVGSAHFSAYFEKVARLLSGDGVALIHTIGSPSGPHPTDKWLAKYIFPGGRIPALSEIAIAAERAGLFITDVEILRMHYANTLHAWRERFLARRDEALALYDERFCRMWEYYLASCELSFRAGIVCVFQVQLARRHDKVPITRDYIAADEALLRKRESVELVGPSL